ncbi:MAG: hypothetical protein ACRD0A_11355 [Acidimicrobiales bacterium]
MTLRPVRFDQDAAEEAATQLLVTAESLLETLWVLDADRAVVTDGWQGHFRDTFDHEIGLTTTGGSLLVNVLQRMAAVIRARAWEAAAAQAAYERQQEEE